MKAIELTKEQKEKLLEMCKALFPEYEKIWFHSLHPTSLTGYLKTNISPNCDFTIHWYEFCMTHLVSKIFPDYKDKAQFIIDTWNSNPIDYLYVQFNKLTAKE